MTTDTSAWDAYWQGRKGEDVTALTGIEHDAELSGFWTTRLGERDKSARFVDLACGAGTVLKTATELGFSDLSGVDISPAAITALSQSLPGVTGTVASATETPFEDAAFTTITSQFGFEYAGAEVAAKEITRILAPNGQFIALSHMHGGAIYDEVKTHVEHCQIIANSGYIEKAKALFRDVYSGDVEAMNNSIEFMAGAREQVVGLVDAGRISLASHLTAGTAELWDKRSAYALEDILAWLDGMEAQRASFEARMQAMLDASMSEAAAQSVLDTFTSQGLESQPLQAFELSGQPAAWIISASKAA